MPTHAATTRTPTRGPRPPTTLRTTCSQRRADVRKAKIIDLFAGAGGWAQGLRNLGLSSLGIENDPAACATATAAGHQCVQADVTALNPAELAPVWGLVGSPPCQAYSTAGKGLGKLDKPIVIACAHELAAGNDSRVAWRQGCRDSRSLLTVEPLRYALALKPRWIALEQVPAVLELWSLFASLLAVHGYHTATGVLSAERYGVPQTRKRALLLASLDGPVRLPEPTHRSYHPRSSQVPPEQIPLLPWVSMAQALGWGMTTRPSLTIVGKYSGSSGSHSRECLEQARKRGAWVEQERVAAAASTQTATNKAKQQQTHSPSDALLPVGGQGNRGSWTWRNGNRSHSAIRVVEDPAPTVHFERPLNQERWVPCAYDTRQGGARPRPVSKPAPTMLAVGLAKGTPVWAGQRPATAHSSGDKHNASDPPGRYQLRRGDNAARVTVQQAATLQGFPADYPWQGSKTSQYTQVGNAVPPPLAESVLAEAIKPSTSRRDECVVQTREPRS